MAKAEPKYIYLAHPPYEVMATPWLTFSEMMLLKDIDKTVDVFYNSGRYTLTHTSFEFFMDLAKHLRATGVFTDPRRPEYYTKALADYLVSHTVL